MAVPDNSVPSEYRTSVPLAGVLQEGEIRVLYDASV